MHVPVHGIMRDSQCASRQEPYVMWQKSARVRIATPDDDACERRRAPLQFRDATARL